MKEKASHKVERLADLVSYQVGSVVSRTIVDKDAGTVTLFAFDSGEGLSEHTAPYDAMVTVLEGEAEVKIAGEPFLLGEGDMIVMPADVPHALSHGQGLAHGPWMHQDPRSIIMRSLTEDSHDIALS
jgi:quercetin dioxygenase-like cupin family protein